MLLAATVVEVEEERSTVRTSTAATEAGSAGDEAAEGDERPHKVKASLSPFPTHVVTPSRQGLNVFVAIEVLGQRLKRLSVASKRRTRVRVVASRSDPGQDALLRRRQVELRARRVLRAARRKRVTEVQREAGESPETDQVFAPLASQVNAVESHLTHSPSFLSA